MSAEHERTVAVLKGLVAAAERGEVDITLTAFLSVPGTLPAAQQQRLMAETAASLPLPWEQETTEVAGTPRFRLRGHPDYSIDVTISAPAEAVAVRREKPSVAEEWVPAAAVAAFLEPGDGEAA